MTIKTKKLLDEMTDALFEKKAVLLTGNTGVGKTYLAKKISEKLVERKYSCFPSSKDQTVNVEIISCHNSVTYEEIVGGITADTDSGKMFFEYKDKIFLETIIRAAVDYNEGKGTKYVLIMDDLQRNDVSTLIGDAVNAIGLEGEEEKLCLNSGMIVEIPPNFYIIGTYNAAETGAILLPSDLISKFYVREILSEIEYITEDLETENAVYYDQVRSLVLNYLDMQYRRSTYDQSRYFLGHGYFSGNNVSLKIRYQLIPILKQYISEGILDSAAEESVHLLETACIKKKVVVGKNVQKSIYSEYRCGVTAAQFIHEDSTRKCSSIPIENLVGRIIDQQLLSDEKIKHAILFNKKVCYREMEVGGVTYQAMLIADSVQHNKIRRSGKSDGRCLYNGGTIFIDDLEYHFTGGFHPRDYVKAACWENTDGYRLGESFGGNPSYGYEDFVRGIKVSTKPGSDTILYETANKVLGNIAELAKKHEKTKFFLIIDEINRANLATVFGELIYGLEYRTEQVATPYSINNNNRISIPDNLYIVGTMNTADKSIGGIDYAIRRRFLFFEQLPDIKVIEEYKAEKGSQQLELNAQACKLFENIETLFEENYLSSEYRKEDVQIGHTYFLVDSKDKLMKRFEYQIIPILKEYYKDGIINFEISDETDGFNGFLNCIAGKINMTSQREDIENIFNDLIE